MQQATTGLSRDFFQIPAFLLQNSNLRIITFTPLARITLKDNRFTKSRLPKFKNAGVTIV
jgi:hypothetical protein